MQSLNVRDEIVWFGQNACCDSVAIPDFQSENFQREPTRHLVRNYEEVSRILENHAGFDSVDLKTMVKNKAEIVCSSQWPFRTKVYYYSEWVKI